MQRACDGGCTTRFEFPCSSETRKATSGAAEIAAIHSDQIFSDDH